MIQKLNNPHASLFSAKEAELQSPARCWPQNNIVGFPAVAEETHEIQAPASLAKTFKKEEKNAQRKVKRKMKIDALSVRARHAGR